MKKLEYKSTIKSRPYLYKETKTAVSLINKGFSLNKIKEESLKSNIFQVESETRMKEVASIITTRLKGLDDFLFDKIESSNIETSKAIVLYAILKNDRLFFEFMNEVFKEKIVLKDLFIRDKDFTSFFEEKKIQSIRVNSWSEYTFKKLKQVYIRILFESGLIENQKGERKIIIPIIDNDVIDYISKTGGKIYIDAILGIG